MNHLVEEGRHKFGTELIKEGSKDRGVLWAALRPSILNGRAAGDQMRRRFLPCRAEGANSKVAGQGQGAQEGTEVGAGFAVRMVKEERKRAVPDFRRAAQLAPGDARGVVVGCPGGEENLVAATHQAKSRMGLP